MVGQRALRALATGADRRYIPCRVLPAEVGTRTLARSPEDSMIPAAVAAPMHRVQELAPAAMPAAALAVGEPQPPESLPADPDGAPAPAPRGYYAAAQGRRGAGLLKALHGIVSSGAVLGYADARQVMFARVDDPRSKNVVTEIYTGKEYERISGRVSANRAGLTAEHSWPQSHGAKSDGRSDLHHLFPAEGTMNSRRSDQPYGDVDKAQWSTDPVPGVKEVSVSGLDAEGNRVFEPRPSVQGDIARAQFYFFLRYNQDRPDDYTLSNFRISLPTLLKWHAEDPPDDAERARNDAIFGVQHNRNPFVDRPRFVERIDFPRIMKRRPFATHDAADGVPAPAAAPRIVA